MLNKVQILSFLARLMNGLYQEVMSVFMETVSKSYSLYTEETVSTVTPLPTPRH